MSDVICWGHNPGMRYTKDTITGTSGKRRDLTPYPSVIAPYELADDSGFTKAGAEQIAVVDGKRYLGGAAAERLPLANREQDALRLSAGSAMYQALAQLSAQAAGLAGRRNGSRPRVLIATALPVGWRLADATAEQHLANHIRAALRDVVQVAGVLVQSEPNALVGSELLDDDGKMRADRAELRGLVCVGDLGGGTINRTVLDGLRPLAGQAASEDLGSATIVRTLAQRAGMQYVDAERRLAAAADRPGRDALADALLAQYAEKVVATFREAWKPFPGAVQLFGGGTVHWIAPQLVTAFPRARVVADPQRAIARGLWRYARLKAPQVAA